MKHFPLVQLYILDNNRQPITRANVAVIGFEEKSKKGTSKNIFSYQEEYTCYINDRELPAGSYLILVSCEGMADFSKRIQVDAVKNIYETIFLNAQGEDVVRLQNGQILVKRPEMIGAFYPKGQPKDEKGKTKKKLSTLTFKEVKVGKESSPVKFWKCPKNTTKKSRKNFLMEQRNLEEVEYAGNVVEVGTDQYMVVSHQAYVAFNEGLGHQVILDALKKVKMQIVSSVPGSNLYLIEETDIHDEYSLLDSLVMLRQDNIIVYEEPFLIGDEELDTVPPLDVLYPQLWHHTVASVPQAWAFLRQQVTNAGVAVGAAGDYTYGLASLVIGIQDPDGVESSAAGLPVHPDLSNAVSNGSAKAVAFYNFPTNQNFIAAPSIADCDTHGTSCIGAFSASPNNINAAQSEGVVGVAGNTRYIAVRVGGVNPSDLQNGYLYASGLPFVFQPALAIVGGIPNPGNAIMSNSWGNPRRGQSLNPAIDWIVSYGRNGKGVVNFQSAGNGPIPVLKFRPACAYEKSIGIAASTLANNGFQEIWAPYSAFGPGIDLCAPSHSAYIPHVAPLVVPACNVAPYSGPVHNPPASYGAITIDRSTQAVTITGNMPGPVQMIANNASVLSGLPGAIMPPMVVALAPNQIAVSTLAFAAVNQAILIGPPNNPGAVPSITLSEGHRVTAIAVAGANQILTLDQNVRTPANFTVGVTPVYVGPANYTDNFGGTSYSTPFTAGVAGLVLSVKPDLTWLEVKDIMESSADIIDVGRFANGWTDSQGQPIVSALNTIVPTNPVGIVVNVPAVPGQIIANSTTLTMASVVGFSVGQAISLTSNAGTEVLVIRSIAANVLTINPTTLTHPLAVGNPAPTVTGGRVPFFSPLHGRGRVNALKAVTAATAYNYGDRDMMIRDFLADVGNAHALAIHSPDIWIRNVNDLVQAPLDFTKDGPHQSPSVNVFNEIGAVVYAGGGANPGSPVISGSYTGNVAVTYRIEIDSLNNAVQGTGNPNLRADTFRWRKLDTASGQPITNWVTGVQILINGLLAGTQLPLPLDEGLLISFPMDVNPAHAMPVGTNAWTFTATPQRAVYARVSNRGANVNLTNLDVYTRFYVALSANTAFTFPTHWQSLNNVNSIAPNGIASNANAAAVYMLGESKIPRNTIGATNPASVLPNHALTSVSWKQNAIPPLNNFATNTATITLKTFLMVHVSPIEGTGLPAALTAANCNNLSYREFMFAEFRYWNTVGAPPAPPYVGNPANTLPTSITVDNFGSELTTNFRVDVVAHVGRFNPIHVQLEVVRENDNGQQVIATFRNVSPGVWNIFDATNTPGTINWLTVANPVRIGGGGALTANEIQIQFTGTVKAAKQHSKIMLRPKIISSLTAGAIIASDEFDIAVIEQPILPTGVQTAPPPAQPESRVFADMGGLTQVAADGYGPVAGDVNNKFRVTSSFTATAAVKAYAISNGVVMVQKVDATHVTVIIKPLTQPGLEFSPVKYYVYRGIRLDSFIDPGNDTLVRPLALPNPSAFITKMHAIHAAQNPPATPFLGRALGYDPANQLAATPIDGYFFRLDPDQQLPLALAGEHIGNFDISGKFGLEIILEEGGDFQPDYAYTRKLDHIIDVTGMAYGTDAEKLAKKLKREQILHFVDPAAFYAMHHTGKVHSPPSTQWTGNAIVTNVVDKFITKRNVYIDIRNENGYSLNFYGNYQGPGNAPAPELGRQLQYGTTTGALAFTYYRSDQATEDSWPILIQTITFATAAAKNPVRLAFRIDDNLKPILYVEQGELTTAAVNFKFVEGPTLITVPPPAPPPPPVVWTNEIAFQSPNTGGGANKDSIAWVFKMHYGRQRDPATVWPGKVVRTEAHHDNVFGPVDINEMWDATQNVKWVSNQDRKYIDGTVVQNFGYVGERGVAFEDTGSGRAIFYAIARDKFVNPAQGDKQSLTGGVSRKGSFFEVSMLRNYSVVMDQIIEAGTPISTITLSAAPAANALPQDLLLLGISKAELNILKALGTLTPTYPRNILLDSVGQNLNGQNGKIYHKYRLGLRGLDVNGNHTTIFPGAAIHVYTQDNLCFTSDLFTQDQPIPTTYTRNYEENIAALPNGLTAAPNITALNQAGKSFTVTGNMLTAITPGDAFTVVGSTGNNGSYTLQSITVNGAGNSVLVCIPANNIPHATADGQVRIANKTFEDYFSQRDQAGALGATQPFATLITNFTTAVNAIVNNASALANLTAAVNTHAPLILNRARAFVNNNFALPTANPDDRMLYWSRLKMLVALKSHEYLLQAFTDRNNLVKLFEDKSRGIDVTAINAAWPGAQKKILIIGMDPFQLNAVQAGNPFYSNPSGAAALYLHGKTVVDPTAPANSAFIQSVVWPARYRDLDSGQFETFVNSFLTGANAVDLILLINVGSRNVYEVQRFATKKRGTAAVNIDNEGRSGLNPVYYEYNSTSATITRVGNNTTLPELFENQIPSTSIVPGTFANANLVYNQSWNTAAAGRAPTGPIIAAANAAPNLPVPPPATALTQGSAGDYFQNELLYRLAMYRNSRVSSTNVGLITLPLTQLVNTDFNAAQTKTTITDIQNIISDFVNDI